MLQKSTPAAMARRACSMDACGVNCSGWFDATGLPR